MKHIVLALSGPTGSGKSEWGIKLAHEVGGVVIAADSRTVYRSLDIGTNKVTYEYSATERTSPFGPIYRIDGIDHYGLNLCDPTEQYTASMFQQFVYQLLPVLWEQRRVPILVGGTGLYIQAVVEGFEFPASANLSGDWRARPTEILMEELEIWDPQTASQIDASNRARVERALAHAFATGQSFRAAQRKRPPDFTSAVYVIQTEKEQLWARLDHRLENWIQHGLLTETAQLVTAGVSNERIRSLGFMYRIALEHLQGQIDEEAMRETLRTELRRFVKRQLTWWRRYPAAQWVGRYPELERSAKRVLKEG